jgi:hypothetical protein
LNTELGICQRVRDTREDALPYWRSLWEARTEERDFLDGDRYEDGGQLYNKDRRRQQFRGQESTNVNRHLAAVVTASPRSLEARPVDAATDPQDGEMAVSVIEWELGNLYKGFDEVDEQVVQDAIDCRSGAAMLDFDPDMGTWGECYWRWKDSNLLMFEPGHDDPHHMKCGWLEEVRRMALSDISKMGKLKGKAKWRGTDEVVADGQIQSNRQGAAQALDVFGPNNLLGVPGVPTDDEHCWVLFHWEKNDPDTIRKQQDERLIPEGERYIGCDNPDCPYRSDTQDALVSQGKMQKGDQLPATMEPCPMCGGPMSRRDVHSQEADVLAYPKGRRLTIMPLFQRLADDAPFYDGAWPVPTARSFPIYWVTRYVSPGRPMGDSDTTRNWEAQIASDQLMTMAFDRIMRHQGYYVMPQVGMYDYLGNRFEFRDDQFNVIFTDHSDPNHPNPQMDWVQGSALDAAWPAYWNAVQTTLLSHQGITDLGLTPDSSKDIAVGTVKELTRQGDLTAEHFMRRKRRALSKAVGVLWDYMRYTYTADRLARLRLGDEDVVTALKGDELPNFDFTVVDTPPFSGLDKDRSEAFKALMEMASNPQTAPFVDVFAEVNKLPPSIVRKIRSVINEQQAAAAAQSPAVMPPGASGAGNPLALIQQSRSQPSPEQAAA